MNYQEIYNKLMLKGNGRRKSKEEYFEAHHILPRCMGGTDDISNIVLLTAREHFVAHRLLIKIYPSVAGLRFALFRMCTPSGNQKRSISSRMYKLGMEAVRSAASEYIGEKNPFYGKTHTVEFNELQRQRGKLKVGEKNPNFGNHWSWKERGYDTSKLSLRKRPDLTKPEIRAKLRDAKLGKGNPNSFVWVLKNKLSGEIISFVGGIKRFFVDNRGSYKLFRVGREPTWELLNKTPVRQ